MTKTLTFHSDPGHAWLEVPKQLFFAVGYAPSRSSYETSSKVYLEEDCDATFFLMKAEEKGLSFEFESKFYNQDCFVRRLSNMSGVGFVNPYRK